MIALIILAMFCVVLAFAFVGIDPGDNLPEVRRKMARLFCKRSKNASWFIETMKRYDDVLGMARDFLEKHGTKGIVEVDGVKIKDNQVYIEYTWKWDWEHVRDSMLVPLDDFIGR